MTEPAIIVKDVYKEFILPQHKRSSLKQVFINLGKKNIKTRQKALNGISFEIKKGEFFGIIGRNGSGKSTLLKILAGVYLPTKGNVEIRGSLTPFIELGVGFNPELSGRDNVFLNGALLGFNRKEMKAMYNDIVEFSELEPFMDQKLKNYSSGMQVRLAFSIAIRAKSDILLIDEVLAVGDANFQKKCMDTFEDLKRAGRTIVFVTHSMDSVRQFCDRAVVVNDGELVFSGDREKAIDIYNKLNFERESAQAESENKKAESASKTNRFGNGKARISSYSFFDDEGNKSIKLTAGKKFSAQLYIEFNDLVENPAVGIMFRKNPQENLFGINNFYEKVFFGKHKKGERLKVTVNGIMPLATGTYYVSFSVTDAKTASNYFELDNLNNVMKVTVQGKPYWGLVASELSELKIRAGR